MSVKTFLRSIKSFAVKTRNAFIVIPIFITHRKNVLLWIYPHIGDLFYALPYVEEYKKMNGSNIVLLGNQRYDWLYRLFPGIDTFCLLPERKVWAFQGGSNFRFIRTMMRKKIASGHFVSNDFRFMATIRPIGANTSLQEYTKVNIYNLPKDFHPRYPLVESDSFLASKKYVIISPYAQSASPVDVHCFEYLVASLKKKGYLVFSNVHGNEKPILGSEKLDCGLLDLCKFSNNASAFISLRSGVSDMVAAMTKTKCFVLFNGYSLGNFATTLDYRPNGTGIFEYYDLVSVQTMDKILAVFSNDE